MWRDYYPSSWFKELTEGEAPASERLRQFAETLREAVSSAGLLGLSSGSTEAARYWAYHLGRSGFFMLQAGAQGGVGL